MQIELENFTAKIGLARDDRMRLTLEYPCEPVYRDRVLQALSDLIRPTAHDTQLTTPPLSTLEKA